MGDSMPKARKTWREKLEMEEGLPKIVDVPTRWEKRYGKGNGAKIETVN